MQIPSLPASQHFLPGTTATQMKLFPWVQHDLRFMVIIKNAHLRYGEY